MEKFRSSLSLAAATVLFLTSSAWAGGPRPHPKIANDLDNADPTATVEVIVQYVCQPCRLHPPMPGGQLGGKRIRPASHA